MSVIQCRACHFQALGSNELVGHIQRVHGFGPAQAREMAAYIFLASLRADNARLRDWIRTEGARNDVCTFDVLGGERCLGCLCERRDQ